MVAYGDEIDFARNKPSQGNEDQEHNACCGYSAFGRTIILDIDEIETNHSTGI